MREKHMTGEDTLPPSPLLWVSKPGEGVLLSARCFLAGGESETLPRRLPWERRGGGSAVAVYRKGSRPHPGQQHFGRRPGEEPGPGQGLLQGVAVAAHLHQ